MKFFGSVCNYNSRHNITSVIEEEVKFLEYGTYLPDCYKYANWNYTGDDDNEQMEEDNLNC